MIVAEIELNGGKKNYKVIELDGRKIELHGDPNTILNEMVSVIDAVRKTFDLLSEGDEEEREKLERGFAAALDCAVYHFAFGIDNLGTTGEK